MCCPEQNKHWQNIFQLVSKRAGLVLPGPTNHRCGRGGEGQEELGGELAMEGVVSVPSFDTIVVDDGGGATSVGELVVYLWSLSQDTA